MGKLAARIWGLVRNGVENPKKTAENYAIAAIALITTRSYRAA